jgi:hypothetical protein
MRNNDEASEIACQKIEQDEKEDQKREEDTESEEEHAELSSVMPGFTYGNSNPQHKA